MESEEEAERLERKTDIDSVRRQAEWAGLKSGMRVADIACGPGKTTGLFDSIVKPIGEVIGVDGSERRIEHAKRAHGRKGPSCGCRNILKPLDDLGLFDFVWVRFFLEYHGTNAIDIVRNLKRIIKPGGILCLADLDFNCRNHYGIPDRLQKTITKVIKVLEEKENFDSRMGIKLYSFLFDLKFQDISVMVEPHHLIYGELSEVDEFNWTKKIEMVAQKYETLLNDYQDGYSEFYKEFKTSFADPRRFTYTPLICCRGVRSV
jgi:ubiquinone/menaquinone biosynthesis C-methylase UbiE